MACMMPPLRRTRRRGGVIVTASTSSRTIQRLHDVADDVLARLTSNAEADESVANCVTRPTSPPFRHRMDAAKAGRLAHERQRTQECLRARASAEVEADNRAEGAHLAAGNLMPRVRRQTR